MGNDTYHTQSVPVGGIFTLPPGAPSFPPQQQQPQQQQPQAHPHPHPRSPSSTTSTHNQQQRSTSTGHDWSATTSVPLQQHEYAVPARGSSGSYGTPIPEGGRGGGVVAQHTATRIGTGTEMRSATGQTPVQSHPYPTQQSQQPPPAPHTPTIPFHQQLPSQHPSPAQAHAQAQIVAGQIEYHNQLVNYYYAYAYQGLFAPATGEQQEKARAVAVDWARKQGIVVSELGSIPHQSQFVPPFAQTAPIPQIPFQPQHTAAPPPSYPSHPSHSSPLVTATPSHPFSTPTKSISQFPSPSSSSSSPRKQPLPIPPTVAPSRQFTPTIPSNLTRSVSLADVRGFPPPPPSSSSSSSDIGFGSKSNSEVGMGARSDVGTVGVGSRFGRVAAGGQVLGRSESMSVLSAGGSGSGSGSAGAGGKRALPQPPGSPFGSGQGPTRSATMPFDLAGGVRGMSIGGGGDSGAASPSARKPLPSPGGSGRPAIASPTTSSTTTAAIVPQLRSPSPVVQVTDRSRSPSPIPLFSVTSPDEAPSEPPSISLPKSTVTITSNPSSPSRSSPSSSSSHPRPPSSSSSSSSNLLLHPRHDPTHPSHYLYHPTSTRTTLEAGKITCAGCHQDMFGRALMAMGREWHPDCFRCCTDGCGVNLEHVQFDGKVGGEGEEVEVYCMVHYEELFAIQCFHCKTPIAESEYLTISDDSLLPQEGPRTYHALHFFCANCGDPFVDPKSLARGREGTIAKPYMVHKGHAYCFNCDVKLYQPKCAGCRKGMGGDVLEALGKGWHVDCFTCCTCKKVLDNDFLVRDYGKKNGGEVAFCSRCYDVDVKSQLDY